jgi:hypothetical protein
MKLSFMQLLMIFYAKYFSFGWSNYRLFLQQAGEGDMLRE